MCCEVLTMYEQFSISWVKLTLFLRVISTELCEQPLTTVRVHIHHRAPLSANEELVVSGCVLSQGAGCQR